MVYAQRLSGGHGMKIFDAWLYSQSDCQAAVKKGYLEYFDKKCPIRQVKIIPLEVFSSKKKYKKTVIKFFPF